TTPAIKADAAATCGMPKVVPLTSTTVPILSRSSRIIYAMANYDTVPARTSFPMLDPRSEILKYRSSTSFTYGPLFILQTARAPKADGMRVKARHYTVCATARLARLAYSIVWQKQ